MGNTSILYQSVEARADGRMDAKNAAAYVGLSAKTFANMRSQGKGPRFLKRGRIFYRREDLDEWLAAAEFRSTAEARFKLGQEAA